MFISRNAQERKDHANFHEVVSKISKGFTYDSVTNSEEFSKDELISVISEFGSNSFGRSKVRVRLNLKTGIFTAGFAAHADNQKELWPMLKIAMRTSYLEIQYEKFSGYEVEKLRELILLYFERGFSVFTGMLYSNGKKSEKASSFTIG